MLEAIRIVLETPGFGFVMVLYLRQPYIGLFCRVLTKALFSSKKFYKIFQIFYHIHFFAVYV